MTVSSCLLMHLLTMGPYCKVLPEALFIWSLMKQGFIYHQKVFCYKPKNFNLVPFRAISYIKSPVSAADALVQCNSLAHVHLNSLICSFFVDS